MNDLINGLLEAWGGLFIGLSCWKLYQDKKVRGVSVWHFGFFMVWGLWNLYYYPSLGQWTSFVGGVGVVLANMLLVAMILYYNYQESHGCTLPKKSSSNLTNAAGS